MKASSRQAPISTGATPLPSKSLRDALGNAALEGITPDAEAMIDLEAVAAGTMTPEQYRQRVKARYGVQE
ncbi:hypothetical protein OKA04_19995 [Luteolibacter flavescens]|uniref:Antitoxin VbhA domain-containing protein n=1 Tax=Luteolibacter flavescens TaxID=1859460 RepID=A0ABT3FTW9_9BACT|nr:hypothetical protein [Luteolibacter flavescens]MCW1887030.1 hypothetical protein [Luteolibacter flavescens]